MFESKFFKFLMSVLEWQVNSSSNFALFFIAMTHNSSVNFKVIPFLLWTKGSHQSSNFDTFKCSGENLQNSSCHFPSNKSVFLQILHHSSMSWKITPLYFLSSNNIYFTHKEPIKVKIFNTSILHQILYYSSISWKITHLYFFSSNNIYFAQKDPICTFLAQTIYTLLKRIPWKSQFSDFQVLWSKLSKFPMSILKRQVK